jgi:hypothetical protein
MENEQMDPPENATKFQPISSSLIEGQRIEIAIRAEVILAQFWRDDDTHDGMRAIELKGWVDVLEGCSAAEMRAAWATYQRSGPRTGSGRLVKPDAGALWWIVMASRPKPKPAPIRAQIAEVPRERITPERAREIMREVWGSIWEPSSWPQNGALGALAQAVLQATVKRPRAACEPRWTLEGRGPNSNPARWNCWRAPTTGGTAM